jgi:iron uptake system component EfeO
MNRSFFPLLLALMPLVACSSNGGSGGGGSGGSSSSAGGSSSSGTMTNAQYQEAAVNGMHAALLTDIKAMLAAAEQLQAAAPTHAWDAQADAKAIGDMKTAWIAARSAYEHVEGALAPLFPSIDNSIDARYDDFLTQLEAQGGDPDLFDGTGVTGMHAIERILYANVIPARVVNFEMSLPGYVAASFPTTTAEANEFKTKLCQKFIDDSKSLEKQWTPANIDVAIAFQGLISLMNEQREKVEKASSDEEESRYSQRTMVDLRDNLAGTRDVYALFEPWIRSKTDGSDPSKDGPTIDKNILGGLDALDSAYKMVSGAEIPQPPPTWSAEHPTKQDLMTPFGKLYTDVLGAVDPASKGSVVSEMNDAAAALGFPEFTQ